MRQDAVLAELSQQHELSTQDADLIKDILATAAGIGHWRGLSTSELADRAWLVHGRFQRFFDNVMLEPIYTIGDDPEAQRRVENIKRSITGREEASLAACTEDFTVIQTAGVARALAEDEEVVHTLRYFTGMGEITFELLSSGWLHDEGVYSPPPAAHNISSLARKCRDDFDAARSVARHLLREHDLRARLGVLSQLDSNGRRQLVDLLSVQQLSGRLSKLSGHKAEMILARKLDSWNIEFEPREKLDTLGTPDISVKGLPTDRKFNIAIPSARCPRILIQCAFYNSNTGSVASKTVRETVATRSLLDDYNQHASTPLRLFALVDGPGWIAMKSHLRKLLILVDEVIQLQSLDNLREEIC